MTRREILDYEVRASRLNRFLSGRIRFPDWWAGYLASRMARRVDRKIAAYNRSVDGTGKPRI